MAYTFGKKAEELAKRKAEAKSQRESAKTVKGKTTESKPVVPKGNIEQVPFAKTTAKSHGVSSLGKAIKKDTNSRVERMIAESPDPEAARRKVQAGNEIEEATVLKGGRKNPMFKSASLTQDRKNFPNHADEIPTGVRAPKSGSGVGGGRAARGGKAAASVEHISENANAGVRFAKNKLITEAYRKTQKFTTHMAGGSSRDLSHANALKQDIHDSLAGTPVADLKGLHVPCIGNNCKRTVPADSHTLQCEGGNCAPHSSTTVNNLGRSNDNGTSKKPVPNNLKVPTGRGAPWGEATF